MRFVTSESLAIKFENWLLFFKLSFSDLTQTLLTPFLSKELAFKDLDNKFLFPNFKASKNSNNLFFITEKFLKLFFSNSDKLLLFLDALKLGKKNLLSKSLKANTFDKNAVKRVWVRSEKDNLKNNSQFPNLITKNSEVTNLTKKDIMIEDNN